MFSVPKRQMRTVAAWHSWRQQKEKRGRWWSLRPGREKAKSYTAEGEQHWWYWGNVLWPQGGGVEGTGPCLVCRLPRQLVSSYAVWLNSWMNAWATKWIFLLWCSDRVSPLSMTTCAGCIIYFRCLSGSPETVRQHVVVLFLGQGQSGRIQDIYIVGFKPENFWLWHS